MRAATLSHFPPDQGLLSLGSFKQARHPPEHRGSWPHLVSSHSVADICQLITRRLDPDDAPHRGNSNTSGTTSTAATAVAKTVGELRPLGITKYSDMTNPNTQSVRVKLCVLGPATGTIGATAIGVSKPCGEASRPGFAKHNATESVSQCINRFSTRWRPRFVWESVETCVSLVTHKSHLCDGDRCSVSSLSPPAPTNVTPTPSRRP